jgi:hypothetical protein
MILNDCRLVNLFLAPRKSVKDSQIAIDEQMVKRKSQVDRRSRERVSNHSLLNMGGNDKERYS